MFKQTKTTLKELTSRYRLVLKKCACLNAIVIAGVTFGANADYIGGKYINEDTVFDNKIVDNQEFTIANNAIARSEIENPNNEFGGYAFVNRPSLLTVVNSSFSNISFDGYGAVLSTRVPFAEDVAKIIVRDSTFSSNHAIEDGGAIANYGHLTISGSKFEKNTSFLKGENYDQQVIVGVDVPDDGVMGGGAIALGSQSVTLATSISSSQFNENKSGLNGGAIATRTFVDGNNSAAKLDIVNSTFDGNMAVKNGGAIDNYFYHSDTNADGVTVADSTFISNKATGYGGAIYNHIGKDTEVLVDGEKQVGSMYITNSVFGALDDSGNPIADKGNTASLGGAIYNEGKMVIKDSAFYANSSVNTGGAIYATGDLTIDQTDFIGNKAGAPGTAKNGGAIYNDGVGDLSEKVGVITLAGTNIFSGNKAAGVLNDIHNDGVLNISGDLTLDGGITGKGVIEFTDTTNLVARLQNMPTINATLVTGVDKVTIAGLVAENGLSTKEYALIDNADAVFANIADSAKENALYKFAVGAENGNILVTRKSVAEQTAGLEKAGLDSNAAKTIAAISGVKTTGNAAADALFADLTVAAQSGDTAAAEAINEVAKTINPESEAVVQSAAVSTQNIINDLAVERMDMGRNGGDLSLTSGGVWVQGLFNRAKSGDKFSANTRGISAGIDETINKDVMLGIGYAYGHSDVSAKTRDTDIDNHSVFLYGQYKPTQWYANATLNYTTSGYKENGSVAGLLAVNSEYRANAFGANVATGYELPFGLTPELGLRYLHVRTNDYTNSLGFHTDAKNTNFLTGIIGARYGFDIAASEALLVRPELSAAAKYDLVSDGNTATVALPGVDAYTLDVERLKRFGGEFGVGLVMSYYGFDLSLTYYIDVREDYTSQTGMAKFRYNF